MILINEQDTPQPPADGPSISPKKKKVTIIDSNDSNHTDRRNVVKRLESGGRILSLIRKAELKRVAKRKIITFLKKKGVSENKIIQAYGTYYQREGLYEITFNQRPLGFSVIMDTRGKNAIVSSVQNTTNAELGMKVASRVYEINGRRVDDLKHKEVLKCMSQQTLPFYVVFKESAKKNSTLAKKREKIEKGLQWQHEEKKEEESGSESDSDTIESYDSDDDEAHVAHHYSRKTQAQSQHKKKKKPKDASSSLFKPHEMDQWDDNTLEDEQQAMLKQLSRLMMGAVAADGLASVSGSQSGGNLQEIDGMTHKRQNTLKTLLDVTQAPTAEKGHELKKSITTSRKFSVSELTSMEEEPDEEFDPEIFKYLSELVGDKKAQPPMTPSTSKMMKELFKEADVDDDPSVVLNLPDFGTGASPIGTSGTHTELQNYPSTGSDAYYPSYSQSIDETMESVDNIDDEDVIESLEQGTTLLKYGKYGKPKYKMFHLTPDHKYLVWYSPKKSSEETRIRIKEIRKIAIGTESKVVEKTKKTDLHETSFTVYYGKSSSDKDWKSLTVTAKNDKEAFVWAQGLKILSDASKAGKYLRTLSKASISSTNVANGAKNGHGHKKSESVIISMDKLKKQSVLNLFSKSTKATTASLQKQHGKHKTQLQKCVDFVMAKTNYRAIANAGQFDKVRGKLEDLDVRLRAIHSKLTTNDDVNDSDLSAVKAELFLCSAELDALKQKLTAIVARPQKL